MKRSKNGTAYMMFSVSTTRDFNTLVSLLQEFHLPVERITSRSESDEQDIVEVHTKGDENYIEFVKYLLKKEQDKAQKLLDKIKVK